MSIEPVFPIDYTERSPRTPVKHHDHTKGLPASPQMHNIKDISCPTSNVDGEHDSFVFEELYDDDWSYDFTSRSPIPPLAISEDQNLSQLHETPPNSQIPRTQPNVAFAPAPGIYISPLQNTTQSNDPEDDDVHAQPLGSAQTVGPANPEVSSQSPWSNNTPIPEV